MTLSICPPRSDMATAEWLTVAQVAALLQISTRSVQRLVAPSAGKNRLLAAKVGGSIRIRKSALDQWLRDREKHPTQRGGATRNEEVPRG
jgi:excisionase family DNA binding protein